MIETTGQDLAAQIEATVRAVPGVTTLFRTGGLVANLVEAGAEVLGVQQTLGAQSARSSLVRWEGSAEGARVELAIGVQAEAGAAQTSHRVHEVIEALCAAQGVTPSEIHITVVHIEDDAAH